MTNLDSILKSRDVTLPTKVRLVKAMVFPVVMYGCECWTVKKAEHQRLDAFELWCWRRLLRVPWTNSAPRILCPGNSPRQEYWSGLPFPTPGDLPDPGIKSTLPASPALQADSSLIEPPGKLLCIYDSDAAAAAKSLQSCLTLCNPIDGSPPGSLVPGILQARTLEWVAISFSNA